MCGSSSKAEAFLLAGTCIIPVANKPVERFHEIGWVTMPEAREIEEILSRLHAKLEGWQVRALFLGAQASTELRLGPHHLLERIFGPDPMLGGSVEEANASLQTLVGLWNELVADHEKGRIHLSQAEVPDAPEVARLQALAKRRAEEILWFTRGVDAGGDDPMEFGEEGEKLFQKLGEASGFLAAYQDLLQKKAPDPSPKDLAETRRSLEELTAVIEQTFADLMTISHGVRMRAVAEYQAMAGRRTDDGVTVRRPVKVGRNDPCPCGSGRKWKRCCGSGTPTEQ